MTAPNVHNQNFITYMCDRCSLTGVRMTSGVVKEHKALFEAEFAANAKAVEVFNAAIHGTGAIPFAVRLTNMKAAQAKRLNLIGE